VPKKLKIVIRSPEVEENNSNSNASNNGEDNNQREAKEEEEQEQESGKKTRKGAKGNKRKSSQDAAPEVVVDKEKDLAPCNALLAELEACDDAWPFLYPVNMKQFPTYKKIIEKPMDLATIRRKMDAKEYSTRSDFKEDVLLIFSNCEVFNEDDSPVGKAGHQMKSLFDARWVEIAADS